MRTMLSSIVLSIAALAAVSCGGKSTPKPAPVDTTETQVEEPSDPEGYGGDGYGEDSYHGGGAEEVYVPPPPQPPNMVGTWKAACMPGGTAGSSQAATFVVTATRWDLTLDSFSDAACAKKTQSLHHGGGYVVGAASATVPDAWDADFTFDARDVTAANAKSAKALGKACGVKKAKAGKPVDVHTKGCAKLGIAPAASCAGDFDVVMQSGSKLHFGVRPADNDLCTAEKRPTAIDTTIALAYQWPATGVAACDVMLQKLDVYLGCAAIPLGIRNETFEGMKAAYQQDQAATWSSLPADAQKAIADGCQQGGDALDQGMATLTCTPAP